MQNSKNESSNVPVFLIGILSKASIHILPTGFPHFPAKNKVPFQDRNVTWSRIHLINETQKLTYLLYVDLLKYTSLSRYHLTCTVDQDNKEYWNLEIHQVHLSDQGYYSCILAAVQPISKLFHLRVIDNPQYLSLSLDSTFDMQREQMISSLSLIDRSVSTIFLTIILLFTI
ncbi:unnamed protein product [Rotaria magnacalcarata]|uniref:Ig-like domain-containing protein n=1 Tax=Rotaria magnacalcarata TaxID=392030 RepID=A0A8S2K9G1_9BILA|nr:unnamed protein product [Rotaria magnacalcarata]